MRIWIVETEKKTPYLEMETEVLGVFSNRQIAAIHMMEDIRSYLDDDFNTYYRLEIVNDGMYIATFEDGTEKTYYIYESTLIEE